MNFLVFIGRLSPFILAFAFPVFFLLILINYFLFSASGLDFEEPVSLVVPENANIESLAKVLEEKNFVRSASIGEFLINKQLRKLGDDFKIKSGEYEIPTKRIPSEVIQIILSSEPIHRKFEIKAGMTVEDIMKNIDQAGLFPYSEAEQAFTKTEMLVRRNIAAAIPEGYFVPMSTDFQKPITADLVAESLLKSGELKRRTAFPDIDERAFLFNMDQYKILIVASLIEKSGAVTIDDKRKVSSVIFNRLTIGMPLENEMSLRYQKGNFDAPVLPQELTRQSPYNTYVKTGLPPTPICTPSLESIKAALYPADTDYLYYSKNKAGIFDYASTSKEYNIKVSDTE